MCACAITVALVPPPAIMAMLPRLVTPLTRCWYFFCSMLVGSASFLTCGAVGAAAVECSAHWQRASRLPPALVVLAYMFGPVCDCSMNGAAPVLRAAPRGFAAFILVWGSCCNPVALWSTTFVLGWRMTVCRALAGFSAAVVTAALWRRLPDVTLASTCGRPRFTDSFVHCMGSALCTFALAAAVSACAIVALPGMRHISTPLFAAIAGAMLSPCSSADAVLARSLFPEAAAQLCFIIASQCADLRQIFLLHRWFGPAYAWTALVSAVLVIVAASHVAIR